MPIGEELIEEERVGETLSSSSVDKIKQEDEKINDTQNWMGELNRYEEVVYLQEFVIGILEIKGKLKSIKVSIRKLYITYQRNT